MGGSVNTVGSCNALGSTMGGPLVGATSTALFNTTCGPLRAVGATSTVLFTPMSGHVFTLGTTSTALSYSDMAPHAGASCTDTDAPQPAGTISTASATTSGSKSDTSTGSGSYSSPSKADSATSSVYSLFLRAVELSGGAQPMQCCRVFACWPVSAPRMSYKNSRAKKGPANPLFWLDMVCLFTVFFVLAPQYVAFASTTVYLLVPVYAAAIWKHFSPCNTANEEAPRAANPRRRVAVDPPTHHHDLFIEGVFWLFNVTSTCVSGCIFGAAYVFSAVTTTSAAASKKNRAWGATLVTCVAVLVGGVLPLVMLGLPLTMSLLSAIIPRVFSGAFLFLAATRNGAPWAASYVFDFFLSRSILCVVGLISLFVALGARRVCGGRGVSPVSAASLKHGDAVFYCKNGALHHATVVAVYTRILLSGTTFDVDILVGGRTVNTCSDTLYTPASTMAPTSAAASTFFQNWGASLVGVVSALRDSTFAPLALTLYPVIGLLSLFAAVLGARRATLQARTTTGAYASLQHAMSVGRAWLAQWGTASMGFVAALFAVVGGGVASLQLAVFFALASTASAVGDVSSTAPRATAAASQLPTATISPTFLPARPLLPRPTLFGQ